MTTPYTPDQNTIARLANAFSRILREGMKPLEMSLIIVRNINEPNPQICHSHDFCDANVLMWHAWAETFDGWTADSTADCDDVCTQNTANPAHIALWDAAWDAAKRASFEPLPFDEAIEAIMPPGDDAFDAREPEQDPVGSQFREVLADLPNSAQRDTLKLQKEIEIAINRASAESDSDTPDFILAEYLTDCLAAWNKASIKRAQWYGRGELPVIND